MEDAMPERQDFPLPANLPVPVDDGAARHLRGMRVPNILLHSTSGGLVDLNNAGAVRAVVYCYPMTGVPGKALPEGWDLIPGRARMHAANMRIPRPFWRVFNIEDEGIRAEHADD